MDLNPIGNTQRRTHAESAPAVIALVLFFQRIMRMVLVDQPIVSGGYKKADSFSMNLSINVGDKLTQYGEKLDIVYNQTQLRACGYKQLIYWDN